jgi:hypothetical protein
MLFCKVVTRSEIFPISAASSVVSSWLIVICALSPVLGRTKRRNQRQHPYRRQKHADPSGDVGTFHPGTAAVLRDHPWYGRDN